MTLLPSKLQAKFAFDNQESKSLNPSSEPRERGASANSLFFSSVLGCRYYDALEALMFFNPQQGKFRNVVSQLVERYGNPKIVEDHSLLRLQIGSDSLTQTLFCLDRPEKGNLIGAIVYVREPIEHLAIIHLAVTKDYSIAGRYADRLLFLRLIEKVKEIGGRIKGIETIEILYDRSQKKIPVRHHVG
jgi:hypothetical protein